MEVGDEAVELALGEALEVFWRVSSDYEGRVVRVGVDF